eukprot:NODE_19716_length_830_cov_15.425320.p3 GENE.NODE_19716_length_830_cov_15.425320~~NODE_19716_length_830_cov_15.425320.p3  ORF type:complete len:112 (+),score=22.63 NODE_19716_length_830_cov_15.425320:446-781(+)
MWGPALGCTSAAGQTKLPCTQPHPQRLRGWVLRVGDSSLQVRSYRTTYNAPGSSKTVIPARGPRTERNHVHGREVVSKKKKKKKKKKTRRKNYTKKKKNTPKKQGDKNRCT